MSSGSVNQQEKEIWQTRTVCPLDKDREFNPCPWVRVIFRFAYQPKPQPFRFTAFPAFLFGPSSPQRMDLIFARCVDHLSLSGPAGATLCQVVSAASGDKPRPSLLRFLSEQFRSRPALFSSPDWTQPPNSLHLIACESLRRRALGHSLIEHPPLPKQAWRVLEHVGRSGPAGILQSELASLVSLSPVMVSHYLGSLTARRLVARKRVVLTTTKTPASTQSNHPNSQNESQLATPRDTSTRITATTLVVLARFASVIASSNASKRVTGARAQLPPPILDGSAYPSHPAASDPDPDVSIHELNVNQGAERILTALRQPPYIRTQRDLKVIAMPAQERPSGCTEEMYQRRRHRAFRAFRLRLQRANLVQSVQRECVDVNGKSRGTHTCLKLTNAPRLHLNDEDIVAPLIVENEEAVSAVQDIDVEDEREQAAGPTITESAPENSCTPTWHGSSAGYLAEVDLVQQVHTLLYESGAKGLSVPEITAIVDGGTKLTSAPHKRIRNIINGISKFAPIIESQKFEGSAMCLKIVLAQFSDKAGPSQEKQTGQGSASKPTRAGATNKASHAQRKSNLARRKDELTSLGLQRQQFVLQLLNEEKAVVLETLGRRVAMTEPNSKVERVDQKVMRRIINDLVLQKRAQVLTTLKPSINKRSQTVRLVTLPHLKADSPEVAHAISMLVSQSLHGKHAPGASPGKRKAEDQPVEDGTISSEAVVTEKIPKRNISKSTPTKRPRSSGKEPQHSEPDIAPRVNAETENQAQSPDHTGRHDIRPESPQRSAVVVHKGRRDTRNAKICRLTAIDYGWMKGKLARARKFHEHIYHTVCKQRRGEQAESNEIQFMTIEASRVSPELGRFTIQSCLMEMTVGDYAAVVGIFKDHGDIIQAIGDKQISLARDVMATEIASIHASRQLTSLVQCLVKLELMEPSQEGKFALRGAGIIRDFGKGMPQGLIPHGISFSSKAAVDMYWKELQQFSQYRHQKQSGDIDQIEQPNEQFDEGSEHTLADVYIRVRWSKGFTYTFTQGEQFQYEVILQGLSGVNVDNNSSAAIEKSGFLSTPLKRFTVGELLDQVQSLASQAGDKISGEKTNIFAEKLLLYSRFRSRHEAPKQVADYFPGETRSSGGKVVIEPQQNVSIFLRLSHGSKSSSRSAMAREMPKKSLKRPKTQQSRVAKKPKLTEGEPGVKTVVELDKFIYALRDIILSRAMAYCKDIDAVPSWSAMSLFSRPEVTPGEYTAPSASHASITGSGDDENSKEPHEHQRENGDVRGLRDGALGNAVQRTANTNTPNKTKAIENGTPNADKSKWLPLDAIAFQEAVTTLCHAQIIQSVVDIFALRLTIQETADQTRTLSMDLESKLLSSLDRSWAKIQSPLRAAVVECHGELGRNPKVTLEGDFDRDTRSERLGVINREFRLQSDMRTMSSLKIGEQLAVLLARYRRIASFRVHRILWREFVFPDDDTDEPMNLCSENVRKVRVEALEQVLLSIINGGRRAQKSGDVMSMLSRFRLDDIARARDRMLMRGSIVVTTTDTMERYFGLSNAGQGGGDNSTRHVLQKPSSKAPSWMKEMQGAMAREQIGLPKLQETEIGKAAVGGRCTESRKAAMALTQMLFFPLEGKGRLRLMPEVELIDGQDEVTAADGGAGEKGEEAVGEKESEQAELVKVGGKSAEESNTMGVEQSEGEKDDRQSSGKRKSGDACSDEGAKEKEEGGDDSGGAPKPIVELRFEYQDESTGAEELRAGENEEDEGRMRMEQKGGDREENGLVSRVEVLVRNGGYLGVTLRGLLSSEVGQECEEKCELGQAMHCLLRKGRAHRLAIEAPEDECATGGEWDCSMGVLYVHEAFITPLLVQSSNTGVVNTGRVASKVACAWSTIQGRGCEDVVENVARSVIYQLTRKPGLELKVVLQSIQERFPGLPGRSIADVVFVLERKGAIRVTRVGKGRGAWERRKADSDARCKCGGFVDGEVFCKWGQGFVEKQFLDVVPAMAFADVEVADLCEIGSRVW